MDAKSDIFVETLKLMAAFISGFTVYNFEHPDVGYNTALNNIWWCKNASKIY